MECKVADDGTLISFYVEMQATAVAIPSNVVIYIDANLNGTADFALLWDQSSGLTVQYNWTGAWTIGPRIFCDVANGQIEIGTYLSNINSTSQLQYYVTTETGSLAIDLPGGLGLIDRAPNAGWSTTTYATNIPEFQLLLVPIVSVFLIILFARKRRNNARVKKEVRL